MSMSMDAPFEEEPDSDEVDDLLGDDDGDDGDPPDETSASGRIAFGRIHSLTLYGHVPDRLLAALEPGKRKEHYQREWILGRVEVEGSIAFGKLGFERRAKGGWYDEETLDFVTVDRDEITYSPFAINLDDMRVAFQTRGQVIKPQSFVGALQALMNEGTTERWRVEHEVQEENFDDWLGRVERIDRIKVKVKRPNPNYHGRNRVEEIVEGLNAEVAELAAKARRDDPQGIDADDDLLQELIGHADRYGSVGAVGQDADGNRLEFRSDRQLDETEVPVDPATRDVSNDVLREHLDE